MKRRLSWLIFLAIYGVMLSGCGGGGSSSDSSSVAGEAGNSVPEQTDGEDDELVMVLETEFDPLWHPVGVYANAASCGSCHRASNDGSGVMRLPQTASGVDISPMAGWQYSMMAQAWNDPYFQAAVEDQTMEFPNYAGDIEDKCLGCHSPMAHDHAHSTGQGLSSTDCPLSGDCYRIDTARMENHAREGISCTLCHQMVDEGTDEPGSGNYKVSAAGDDNARTIYGPYENPLSRPMQNNTDYRVKHSGYISSSEHCGSCHDLDTPTFDINTGHPAEPVTMFREQSAYSEWLNSRFDDGGADDRSCQDCHMQRPDGYQTAIAVARSGASHPFWPQRSPFAMHSMAGGNTYVLGLLKTWRRELGIEASTTEAGFDAAINNGRSLLSQAADITLASLSKDQNELQLTVRISNNTGHKLPTGYPSRRMWLQLTVSDALGQVLFESGKPDGSGYLAVDSHHLAQSCLDTSKDRDFISSSCYEPHRKEITNPQQVAIYEAVMADTNRHITYSLLYGASYLKDNRIPPAGFSTLSANYDSATSIAGTAQVDSDFNRAAGIQGSGSDTVHFRIALPNSASGRLSVEARLWYQSIRPTFIAAMAHRGEKSDRMRIMYQQQSPVPELLARDSLIVEP